MRAPNLGVSRPEPASEVARVQRRSDRWLMRCVSAVGTFILLAALLIATPTTGESSSAFSFNWMGTPTAPQSVVPSGWDVQIHKRDTGDSMEPMDAQHGVDCAAPPATHPINTLAQGMFMCKNHLMTSIGDSGYGEIALTPDHMADWSSGTTAIKIDVSTQQFNSSDWVEVWVSPFAQNTTLPLFSNDGGIDLQGPPKSALVFSFNHSGLFSTYEGDVNRVDNFNSSMLPKARSDTLASIVAASATVRTTYEMDISAGHIRFGLPAFNVWWTDTNIAPLSFSQGVVQMVQHSYNPLKHDPGTGIDTWHWSNYSISNSAPFTILNATERSIQEGGPLTAPLPAPAPSNAFLRFSGIGVIQVSYNGGATWVPAVLQTKCSLCTHEEHFSTYWSPIPTGTQTVMFQGSSCPTWYPGPWRVRDPTAWSL